MTGVDFALDVLEIIAVLESLVHVNVTLWNQRPFELRQFRHRRLRTHVRPDHAAGLAGGIRRLADLVFEAALSRLIGHVNAGACHVKLPAVIHATQSALLALRPKNSEAPRCGQYLESRP